MLPPLLPQAPPKSEVITSFFKCPQHFVHGRILSLCRAALPIDPEFLKDRCRVPLSRVTWRTPHTWSFNAYLSACVFAATICCHSTYKEVFIDCGGRCFDLGGFMGRKTLRYLGSSPRVAPPGWGSKLRMCCPFAGHSESPRKWLARSQVVPGCRSGCRFGYSLGEVICEWWPGASQAQGCPRSYCGVSPMS